jgi:ABC-type protease/lipase transport system fused ATPase/permease subunit
MRAASNTWIVILGIVILVALVVALERHIRRSTTRSSTLSRQARVSANEALRRRLESKVVTQVGKPKQELERTRE